MLRSRLFKAKADPFKTFLTQKTQFQTQVWKIKPNWQLCQLCWSLNLYYKVEICIMLKFGYWILSVRWKQEHDIYAQSGFFWGGGEANSQTNSPQEADDRPKSLQSVNSVALMVCWQYGLPIIWSAGYMICRLCLQTVWSAGYMICRLCLQTVWSVACMVCRLYDLRTVWFTECIGYSMNGLHTVWSSERMGCQL